MKYPHKLFFLFLIIPSLSYADWDKTDYVLGITAVAALVVDWGQTRYIAKHPETHREMNIFLGEHPSVGRVNTYFGGVILGTVILANWLSPTNRKAFLGTITAVELIVTHHNRGLGVKIAF